MATRCILAVDVETEIANFVAGLPFQNCATARLGSRVEINQLNGCRRLNCRDRGRAVAGGIRIARGGTDRRSVGRSCGTAEGVSGYVYGDDDQASDGQASDVAIHRRT